MPGFEFWVAGTQISCETTPVPSPQEFLCLRNALRESGLINFEERGPVQIPPCFAVQRPLSNNWSSTGASPRYAKTRRLPCLADLLSRSTCQGEECVRRRERTTSAFEPNTLL
jgi:hypothetical protein